MESLKGGCCSHILSEVIPILEGGGREKDNFLYSQHGMRALGLTLSGNGNDGLF